MRGLKRILLVLFSLSFWVVSFAWMGVAAIATIALTLLGIPYQRFHAHIPAPIFGSVVRLAGNRLRVAYDPGFDPERRSVFLQNHVNLLDGHVASAVIPHAFCGLMNAWQAHIPIYGWMMALSKGIFIGRGAERSIVSRLSEAARERNTMGMSILTFPEAHRTLDGRVRKLRSGVFIMARNAGMPVVPLTVRGNYAANHKGTYVFTPGQLFEVYVGPQLETEDLSDAQLRALANAIRELQNQWIDRGTWPSNAADVVQQALESAEASEGPTTEEGNVVAARAAT